VLLANIFDLRDAQSVMCAGDLTLEGPDHPRLGVVAPHGQGISHQRRSGYDAGPRYWFHDTQGYKDSQYHD